MAVPGLASFQRREERRRAAAFSTSSSKSKSLFVQIVLLRTTDFDNLLRRSADKR